MNTRYMAFDYGNLLLNDNLVAWSTVALGSIVGFSSILCEAYSAVFCQNKGYDSTSTA